MAEDKEKTKKEPVSTKVLAGKDFNLNSEEMAGAGLHFGHKASKVHPKMKPFIYGMRNSVHIIDLEKTEEKFKEALKLIREIISNNKILLLVGTKVQVKNLVKDSAKVCGLPYINERWLGGTFTNFKTIKKRIEYFKELEEKKKKGELNKYTKKERAKIDKELMDLGINFGGIKELKELPEAIFVLDINKDAIAIKEARKKMVKIIGIVDTNADPSLVDYPIPANDDAISSVKYILEKVKEVVLKAKQ